MCWPAGKIVNNSFAAYATLLKSGIKAVRDFSATSSSNQKLLFTKLNCNLLAGG
jgi:hypothetical protein